LYGNASIFFCLSLIGILPPKTSSFLPLTSATGANMGYVNPKFCIYIRHTIPYFHDFVSINRNLRNPYGLTFSLCDFPGLANFFLLFFWKCFPLVRLALLFSCFFRNNPPNVCFQKSRPLIFVLRLSCSSPQFLDSRRGKWFPFFGVAHSFSGFFRWVPSFFVLADFFAGL